MKKEPTKSVRDESKKAFAELLYMAKTPQKEIADRVDISPNTLTSWIEAFGWKEKRAAKTITRSSLVNKLLLRIDQLLDEAMVDAEGGKKVSEDQLSKIASAIEKLDKQASVVDAVETMLDFYNYLDTVAATDRSITQEKLQWLTRHQDNFINDKFKAHGNR